MRLSHPQGTDYTIKCAKISKESSYYTVINLINVPNSIQKLTTKEAIRKHILFKITQTYFSASLGVIGTQSNDPLGKKHPQTIAKLF